MSNPTRQPPPPVNPLRPLLPTAPIPSAPLRMPSQVPMAPTSPFGKTPGENPVSPNPWPSNLPGQ